MKCAFPLSACLFLVLAVFSMESNMLLQLLILCDSQLCDWADPSSNEPESGKEREKDKEGESESDNMSQRKRQTK